MKITSVTSAQVAQAPAGTSVQSSQDARSRAIAALTQAPAPQSSNDVVQNQNAVQPEEMTAIRPPTREVVEPKTESDESPAAEVEQKTEDPLSSQYALLARKERALRAKAQQQEQALKQREEALKTREAAIAAKDQEYSTGYISKQHLKANTLEALNDAEISYDELTQQLINNQTPLDPRTTSLMSKLEAKIAKLEAELGEGKKSQIEQQTQSYQAAVKQIESDVKSLVASDPSYEAVKATNSVKDVVELIERTYKEDGTLLSVEEAAQLVEDHLLGEIDKLTNIEKVKRRLSPKPAVSSEIQVQTPAKPAPQQQPMKTLTNANSSTRQLSARERALLAFRGELKNG